MTVGVHLNQQAISRTSLILYLSSLRGTKDAKKYHLGSLSSLGYRPSKGGICVEGDKHRWRNMRMLSRTQTLSSGMGSLVGDSEDGELGREGNFRRGGRGRAWHR